MTITRIAIRIISRVLAFGIAGCAMGALIGAFVGGIYGALLGAMNGANPKFGHGDVWDSFVMGGAFGVGIGAFCGAVCGALAFVSIGLMQRAGSNSDRAFRQALRGAFLLPLVGAGIGAGSGTVLWTILGQVKVMPQPLEPFTGGFFWGSIVSFVACFFLGAVLGGTGRLAELSLRQLRNWVSIREP